MRHERRRGGEADDIHEGATTQAAQVELARVRLRGLYAVIAGLILLVALPLFEGSVVAPTGYGAAVRLLAVRGNFAALVAWIAGHGGTDVALRIVELLPFLLAVALPSSLGRVVWQRGSVGGRVAGIAGQVGFLCVVLAGVLGILTSSSAAGAYAQASNAAQQSAATGGFATSFVVETLIGQVLGSVLLALFLLLSSVRMVLTGLVTRWLAYLGLAEAALLAATALLRALAPAEPEAPTSAVEVVGLGLWLVCAGVVLLRIRTLYARHQPAEDSAPATGPAAGVSATMPNNQG